MMMFCHAHHQYELWYLGLCYATISFEVPSEELQAIKTHLYENWVGLAPLSSQPQGCQLSEVPVA